MNSRLLNQLMELSEEEKDYRVGNFEKLEEMYRLGENMEIDSELFLSENRLITVRRHSRFAEFPLHGHNYIELMYVCHGEIVQIMDGKKIILREGDFMMLNQYMKHRILRADYEDIAQKVGYANFSYFYRGFKNRYGCTPKEYRIRYKEKSRIRI